jgi:hypothetical protein
MSSIPAGGLGDFSPTHRKIGRTSRYVDGGTSKLASGGEPEDAQQGAWLRKDLLKMDAKFCAAVERAFRLGLERRPVCASDIPVADSGSSTSPRRRASG